MDRLTHTKESVKMRRRRVRAKIHGTESRPRLSVHISINHVTAQIINDDTSQTLVYVTTVGRKLTGNKSEQAEVIGKDLAKKAKSAKINQVIFDRGEKLYHGRIKALAEAARTEGLEF